MCDVHEMLNNNLSPIDRFLINHFILYGICNVWDRQALVKINRTYFYIGSVNSLLFYVRIWSDHDCLVVGGAGSVRSTSVASAGAATAWLDCATSAGNCGITCDCVFLTASMFTLVDKFFCRVCSEVFDNLSLNALSAICLERLNRNLS